MFRAVIILCAITMAANDAANGRWFEAVVWWLLALAGFMEATRK